MRVAYVNSPKDGISPRNSDLVAEKLLRYGVTATLSPSIREP